MADWKDGLPEELKNAEGLKDFKDTAALAKSFLETKTLVGNSLRPPGPDASPEAKAEFAKKLQEKVPDLVPASDTDRLWGLLGKPTKPEEYVAEAGDAPPEVKLDMEGLRKAATELGLTKGQFRALVAATAKMALDGQTVRSQAESALKKEWGVAYAQNTLAAQEAAKRFGMSTEEAATMQPAQARYWAGVARSLGEAKNLPDGNRQSDILTPQEAELQLKEIQANPAYFDRKAPEHERLVFRANKLAELAYKE